MGADLKHMMCNNHDKLKILQEHKSINYKIN